MNVSFYKQFESSNAVTTRDVKEQLIVVLIMWFREDLFFGVI
jgi:hypothetical protein